MTEIRFDTDAMVRVGEGMKSYHGVTDPVARSMGKVPGGLPPDIASEVKLECHRLEAGVRALGERTEGLGAFAVAVAERAKVADGEGGDAVAAQKLLNIAFLKLPGLQNSIISRQSLLDLQRTWPDVFNAIDDVEGAKAADDLVSQLSAGGLKNLDALAAFKRAHPGEPVPARLRALDSTLKGAGKIAPWLARAGVAGAAVTQLLKDLGRKDLEFGDKLIRAAESGAIAYGAGKAASAGVRAIIARAGLGAVRGPWGWAAAGAGFVLSAFGADRAGKIVSGEVLFEPNPNDKAYMKIPPAERSRIETEGRGPYRYPDVTLHHFEPDEKKQFDALSEKAGKLDERIGDQYSALHTKEPIEPVRYRRMADDLLRSLDERRQIADAMDEVID